MSGEAFVLKPLGGADGDLALRPSFGAQFRKGAGAGLGGLKPKVRAGGWGVDWARPAARSP
jgi:hypothetical protein